MLIGLVGQPGAGKTTIAEQIDKWADVSSGVEVIYTSRLLTDAERGQVMGPEDKIRYAVTEIAHTQIELAKKTIIIDSMPRTLGQLYWLNDLAFRVVRPLGLVFVEPPGGVILERLIARGREHEAHWLDRLAAYQKDEQDIFRFRPKRCLTVTSEDSIANAREVWEWAYGLRDH